MSDGFGTRRAHTDSVGNLVDAPTVRSLPRLERVVQWWRFLRDHFQPVL